MEPAITHKQCEMVSIKVQTYQQPIIIAACYRPPSSTITQSNNLFSEISKLCKKYQNCPLWIGGDLNLPDITWESKIISSYQYPKQINESFIEAMDSNNLDQIVRFPTRGFNPLDILITNRPSLVVHCKPVPGFGDHSRSKLTNIKSHPQLTKQTKRK